LAGTRGGSGRVAGCFCGGWTAVRTTGSTVAYRHFLWAATTATLFRHLRLWVHLQAGVGCFARTPLRHIMSTFGHMRPPETNRPCFRPLFRVAPLAPLAPRSSFSFWGLFLGDAHCEPFRPLHGPHLLFFGCLGGGISFRRAAAMICGSAPGPESWKRLYMPLTVLPIPDDQLPCPWPGLNTPSQPAPRCRVEHGLRSLTRAKNNHPLVLARWRQAAH